jgi:putative transposase
MLRAVELKLYLTASQEGTLERWLRSCCWLYNRCLEQRIKAYQRRKEAVSLYAQTALLTRWRSRIARLREVPAQFARDALRRVDRGMRAFFRRCAAGEKPGFPRFRSHRRYNTLEQLQPGKFLRKRTVFVPGIGEVRARGRFGVAGKQKGIRIVRRAHGWYAQILVEQATEVAAVEPVNVCGIDVGLESFAALDSGEKVGNPRPFRRAAKKLRAAQQRLCRRQKGSKRREKARRQVRRLHEKVARKRKGFAHRLSRELVNRFDALALEKLNVKRMVHGNLAKSIHDAAWSFFVWCVAYKAASAGKQCVLVDPRGTSQECPQCGTRSPKKELSERSHRCPACGLVLDRDVAAAVVIRDRAFGRGRGGPVSPPCPAAGPTKRAV